MQALQRAVIRPGRALYRYTEVGPRRTLISTTILREQDGGQQSAPASPSSGSTGTQSSGSGSFLDELLSSEDAFERDEDDTTIRRPPRGREDDELNKEWGSGFEEPGPRRSPYGSDFGKTSPRRHKAQTYTGALTAAETKIYRDIFDLIGRTDSNRSRTQGVTEGKPGDGDSETVFQDDAWNPLTEVAFGSSTVTSDQQRLRNFERRTLEQRARMRMVEQSRPHKDRTRASSGNVLEVLAGRGGANDPYGTIVQTRPHAYKNRTGLVRELIAAEGFDEREVEMEIDRARAQMSACQTQYELWQWSINNVWGTGKLAIAPATSVATEEPAAETADGSSATTSTDNTESKVSPIGSTQEAVEAARLHFGNDPTSSSDRPQYGITSPCYAPVLRMLLKLFRERFRAPHAALAVLRTARNAGPQSVALGCTPNLYAEAIRTCYHVLHDAEGALKLVREARETGALAPTPTRNESYGMREARPMGADDTADSLFDDSSIRSVVEEISADVRRRAYRASEAQSSDKSNDAKGQPESHHTVRQLTTPLAFQDQMDVVQRMQDIISPRTRSWHKEGGGGFRSQRPTEAPTYRNKLNTSRPQFAPRRSIALHSRPGSP